MKTQASVCSAAAPRSVLRPLRRFLSVLAFGPLAAALAGAAVVPVPGNPSQALSSRYTLTAGGLAVQVKAEAYGFDTAMFTTDGPTTVAVTMASAFTSYSLLPSRHNIAVTQSGRTLTFTIPSAVKLVLKVDALTPLAILATGPETNVPNPGDPGVLYFPAGTTTAGTITAQSNQTIYLAPGALVLGRIAAANVTNLTIKGRGILDATNYSTKTNKFAGLDIRGSSNVVVQGIGVRCNNTWWQSSYLNCQTVSVSDINEFGLTVNTDGVDIDGVKNFTLTNSFIRSEDDGLGWHALDAVANGETITDGATADNVVIWNTGAGNGMRMVGASMEDQMWRNITISNVDILNHAGSGIYSDHSDWAWVENLQFKNVTISGGVTPISLKIAKTTYSNNNGFLDERGHFDGLVFDHVTADGGTISLTGFDATHKLDHVYFNSCTNAGVPIASTGNLTLNSYVTNVQFNQTPPAPYAAPAGIFEAEYTDTTTNTKPQITFADGSLSNGKGKLLKAGAVNDYVAYAPNVATAGTYDLRVALKKTSDSGIAQFSFNGQNLGTPVDLFAGTAQSVLLDFGAVTVATPGTQSVKATVTGKNASSTSYNVEVDFLSFSAATPVVPAAPTGVAATPGNTQATVSWFAVAGANGYNVKRATTSGGPYATVGSAVPGFSFVDTGLTNGTTYYYVVSAVNTAGESANSAEASAKPVAAPVVIIQDNADATGVTIVGAWTSSVSNAGYYATNYIHDGNTGATGGKSVKFTPTLATAGTYAISINWPAAANRATNTPVDVFNGTTTTTFSVNQQQSGTWVFLGNFSLPAGSTAYVKVRNDGANGYVIADAVKFAQQ